ncbi:MAG: CHASE4 domain-containing protein [Planctomycetota bacterium]
MSVRVKILLVVTAVFAGYMGVAQIVHRCVVFPSFAALERKDAAANQDRCAEAIHREVELLSFHLSDWSSWDDTYQFIVDENEQYKKANLVPTMFTNNHLNLVCFFDVNSRTVWSGAFDLSTGQPMTFEDFSRPSMDPESPLFNIKDLNDAVEGVMITEHGPLLVASRRILNNENEGPSRGTMVMGKLLDEEETKGIAQRTHVDMDLLTIPGQALPPDAEEAVTELSAGTPLIMRETGGGKSLQLRSIMAGIDGKPALLMTTRIPRDITAHGKRAMGIAVISDMAAGLAILLLMWTALQRTVVGPLTKLTNHAITVARTDDLSRSIDMRRTDEIGTLAREFDRMMHSLSESRARLLDTAHRAGMAEIAAGVIHNVGNVLNSVNVSAKRAVERVDALDIADLNDVVGLMREHAADLGSYLASDEKGKLIPEFLAQLGEDLAGEQREVLNELQSLTKNVQHIAEIVDTQQTYANAAGTVAKVSINALIEDALRINAAGMERHSVRVIREFQDTPPIMTERHKVLQILVNLLSNAKYALDDCTASERRVTIRVRAPRGDQAVVRVEICDNGVGIPKEHLAKLFSYGFTTRKEGHGLGLHDSANAAKSLGGRLFAESEGPGVGATFTLELPFRVAKVMA